MINLLIIHDLEYDRRGGTVRWAHARRSHALKKYAPDDFNVTRTTSTVAILAPELINSFDIVFNLDYSIAPVLRAMCPDQLIVSSFNRDNRTRWELWEPTCEASSHVICNNRAAYEAGGRRPGTSCIPNGVDVDLFRNNLKWSKRPVDVIWCGSTAERTCKNFSRVIEPLSREFKTSFIPVDRNNDAAILPEGELVDWYNSGKVVVCASTSEGGGPSYLMEAMACGCIPVTTWVGSVPEFHDQTKHPICADDTEAFIRGIRLAMSRPNLSDLAVAAMQKNRYGGNNGREQDFYDLFRKLVRKKGEDALLQGSDIL